MERDRAETTALPSGPYVDWYEAWRARHGRDSRAQAAEALARARQLRWMMHGFAAWAALVMAAALASIWWLA